MPKISRYSPDNRPSRWIRLGDAIRSLRKSKGLSQEEAADRAGVSRGTWIDWEGSARSKRDGRIPDERVFMDAMSQFCISIGEDPRTFSTEEATYTRESASPFRKGFGVTVAVRQWRGALAADHETDDCHFEEVEPYELPVGFLIGGMDNLSRHHVFQINGTSLENRAFSGERILTYDDTTRYDNSIVMADSPEGVVYVKGLVSVRGKFQLHSIRAGAACFTDLDGWKVHGYAIAIIGDPDNSARNIEWLFGKPLKAFGPVELAQIRAQS